MKAPRDDVRPSTPRRERQPQGLEHRLTSASRRARPGAALTPDGLRRRWELHHPGRPEVASALERLFRRRY
jgi:hypothetical protein